MTADQTLLDDLLLAAGRGDRAAFAQVYDTTSQRIYGVISGQLYDREKAEALTLSVFLEIWRTSPRFDPAAFPALLWIMTCAQRIAHPPDDK